jgi:hypothetical protein
MTILGRYASVAPRDAIHINDKWLPDLDFEYFFTPYWSTELVLTYPQSQTVTVSGTPIGSFKHLTTDRRWHHRVQSGASTSARQHLKRKYGMRRDLHGYGIADLRCH